MEFYELANAVPGFGGMYGDESGASVYLTDLSRRPAAEAVVRRFADRHNVRIGSLKAVQGDYDWRQLYLWRQSLDELLIVLGVVRTDIDESKNRIVVGVESDAVKGFVLAEVGMRGIPRNAVEFIEAGYPEPDASLRNTVRPLAGGLQIDRPGGGDCTLGWIGISNNAWFVTNSHCTSNVILNGFPVADGAVNNVQWYQSTVSTFNFIGTEQIDPPFFSGGSCPAGTTCRWSDSSLASFGTGSIARGRIKRTSGPNNGSVNIVGDFRIVAERAFPEQGMTLHKVGRTTGWTSGTVTSTCVNTSIGAGSPKKFLCQDLVSYGSGGGDSGSPVFERLSGNDVQLVGIHWGRDNLLNRAIMSAMVNIEFETIELNECDPAVESFFCVR